ncbi:hypothetical protein C8Q80DRAFT_1276644 [Daedaleopsis nitida]|nr:hypothetical protein C8Q80DRAFT_1276644 [Daedaleopsis nitida]
MPASPLPLDIVEHVIDALFDDRRSLATCAQNITRNRWQHTLLLAGLKDPPTHRCAHLFSLLHANPHLALYVRTLTVQGAADSAGHRALRIVWHGMDTFDLTLIPSVRSLTFVRMNFKSLLDLVPLMQSLPALEELVLDELAFVFPGHIPAIRTRDSAVLDVFVSTGHGMFVVPPPTHHDLAGTILAGALRARTIVLPAQESHAGDTEGAAIVLERECEGACPRLRQVAVEVLEPRTPPFQAAGVQVDVRVNRSMNPALS